MIDHTLVLVVTVPEFLSKYALTRFVLSTGPKLAVPGIQGVCTAGSWRSCCAIRNCGVMSLTPEFENS